MIEKPPRKIDIVIKFLCHKLFFVVQKMTNDNQVGISSKNPRKKLMLHNNHQAVVVVMKLSSWKHLKMEVWLKLKKIMDPRQVNKV